MEKIYRVLVDKDAAKFISSLTKKIQRQIMGKILALKIDPKAKGQPIINGKGLYKIRSGDYRISYQVKEAEILVIVVRVGNRRDFYDYYGRN
ncbi:MAG: type II toxin-antitoxin system RelE/ParE family toxin [Planctomycetaceae bacterium]|nr:type II toxin-antitoxin system RelE/ParE family toxin [Planctomycetaceae bacterium]